MKVIGKGIRCSVFGLLALFCSTTYAQSPAEFVLYMKLNAELFSPLADDIDDFEQFADEMRKLKIDVGELKDTLKVLKDEKAAAVVAAKAVESVLKKPDEFSAVILYCSANRAFREQYQLRREHRRGRRFVAQRAIADKHLEDSAFLFYAAQLRARFDEQCFPPTGKGGDSPLVLFAALSQTVGGSINPAIMNEPKLFENVLDRLGHWSPKASEAYHPGYEFTERRTEIAAQEAAKANREEFLKHMAGYCTLLNIPEYFAAKRIVQAYNMGVDGKRPSDEVADKAAGTIIRIEKEKGIKILTDSFQKPIPAPPGAPVPHGRSPGDS